MENEKDEKEEEEAKNNKTRMGKCEKNSLQHPYCAIMLFRLPFNAVYFESEHESALQKKNFLFQFSFSATLRLHVNYRVFKRCEN
jgi:hypothetical protein